MRQKWIEEFIAATTLSMYACCSCSNCRQSSTLLLAPTQIADITAKTVSSCRPDLANLKSALVVSNARMKAELAGIEDHILALLSAASGNILEDEELINTLAQSKVSCKPKQHSLCCWQSYRA